jgi:hypothetical protein
MGYMGIVQYPSQFGKFLPFCKKSQEFLLPDEFPRGKEIGRWSEKE